MRVLVSGGAGYIGSHTVVQLVAAGHDVVPGNLQLRRSYVDDWYVIQTRLVAGACVDIT